MSPQETSENRTQHEEKSQIGSIPIASDEASAPLPCNSVIQASNLSFGSMKTLPQGCLEHSDLNKQSLIKDNKEVRLHDQGEMVTLVKIKDAQENDIHQVEFYKKVETKLKMLVDNCSSDDLLNKRSFGDDSILPCELVFTKSSFFSESNEFQSYDAVIAMPNNISENNSTPDLSNMFQDMNVNETEIRVADVTLPESITLETVQPFQFTKDTLTLASHEIEENTKGACVKTITDEIVKEDKYDFGGDNSSTSIKQTDNTKCDSSPIVNSELLAGTIKHSSATELSNNCFTAANTQMDKRKECASTASCSRGSSSRNSRSSSMDDSELVDLVRPAAYGDIAVERLAPTHRPQQLRSRISSSSSGMEVIGDEFVKKLKKHNRRRRSFSLCKDSWSTKIESISSTLRKIFRWGCRREDSRSRASIEMNKNNIIATLSNTVSNNGVNVSNSLASSNSSDSSAKNQSNCKNFANRNVAANKSTISDLKNSASRSPSLSLKSVKSVINKVSVGSVKVAKISPLEDLIALNKSESTSSCSCSNTPPSTSRQASLEEFSTGSQNVSRSNSVKLGETAAADRILIHNYAKTNQSSEIKLKTADRMKKNSLSPKIKTRSSSKKKDNDADNAKPEVRCEDQAAQDVILKEPTSATIAGASALPTAPPAVFQHVKAVRSRRLMKEFQELTKASRASPTPVFSVALVNDCLFEWKVNHMSIEMLSHR